MSLNYTMLSRPPQWVSAHRECRFKYRLPQATLMGIGSDGIYAKLIMSSAFTTTVAVGDRIYISPGTPYTGYHIIRDIGTGTYTLETEYTGFVIDAITVWHVLLPEVQLYKGYAVGELSLPLHPSGSLPLHTIQPRTLVATFKPEAGPDGLVEFDISGYLKAIITEPYKAGYNDTETSYHYKQFFFADYIPLNHAKVDVMIEGNLECQLNVANAAISTPELNRYYVDTARPLAPPPKFVFFDYGVKHFDMIQFSNQIRYKL